jgi:hypothetical protein
MNRIGWKYCACRFQWFRACCLLLLALTCLVQQGFAQSSRPNAPAPASSIHQQRVIILTDIGADPDDTMSLVRLLTYSNEIDIRGLVATTSVFQKDRIEEESIRRVLKAYQAARPSLLRNASGYPAFETLSARVSHGLPVYGMEGVGEGHDSPGSNLIVAELERPDDRPLWISVWGGPNTLAQALWKIRKTRTDADAEKLYRKLRVYTISDQDDSGAWIRRSFPSVFYICSPGNFDKATWTGFSTGWPGADSEVISREWLARNIQQGHGPLGAAYPDIAYGMEGDTPSYLALIPNGLNDPEHPNYGGWGGRYELYQPTFEDANWQPSYSYTVRPVPETRPLWTNAVDTYTPLGWKPPADAPGMRPPVYTSIQATIWRWRDEIQNDFAARMCWASKPFSQCNHPPVPVLIGPAEFTVTEGEPIVLDATGSHDPDGDSLSYYWFPYLEAGDFKEPIGYGFFAPNLIRLVVTAPHVDAPRTVHFILKVTDKGTPPLTRYKRVIVHIRPRGK